MSAEFAMRATLVADGTVNGLIAGRINPIGRAIATLPAIAYQRIDTPRIQALGGLGGLAHPLIQVNCYAATQIEAEALAKAVRVAWADFSGVAGGETIQAVTIEDEDDLPELSPGNEGDRVFARRLDFTVWIEE